MKRTGFKPGVELRDARQWVDEETGEIMGGVQ